MGSKRCKFAGRIVVERTIRYALCVCLLDVHLIVDTQLPIVLVRTALLYVQCVLCKYVHSYASTYYLCLFVRRIIDGMSYDNNQPIVLVRSYLGGV